jgi:hypothetical protein
MPELGPTFEGSVHILAFAPVGVVVEETVVGLPPLDSYEPNDSPDKAYTITVGTAYNSYISHGEDPDWYRFEITSPSLLTVTLDQLPADYDLVIFGDLLAAPPVPNSQMVDELADGSSVDADGNLDAVGGAWFASGGAWFASGGAWFASGGAWFASGGAWFASSAQPGTESEVARTIAFEPGTYFVLVYSEGGQHSEQPYRLQVQAEPLAGTGACGWTPTYTTTQPTGVYAPWTDPWTLILYNKTRLDQTYGVTAGNIIAGDLGTLADLDSVRGLVVPVDNNGVVSATYAAWNASPNYCTVSRANVVGSAIRNQIISPTLAAHSTISYVVLIGGDEQIPFRRVPDATTIANERTYQNGLQAELGALFAAFNQGYILTDDFYGTRPGDELYWRGHGLWLPSLAVGRLVETPNDILGFINGYLSNSILDADTALVTGYDFLSDSAEAISETFASKNLPPTTLINETWDADDLRAAWLDTAPDLASVNAHFEHWRAIPATTTAGYVENADILNATGDLNGDLGFSMGCHAGLNVPDGDVLGSAPQTHPDLPQALARRGSYWVGNTGYGYGMDDAIEASEMLMWMFAQELGSGSGLPAGKAPMHINQPRDSDDGVPVGQALVQAKQRYLGSLPSGGLSVYHEKAMIEATLYGLPMYRVAMPSSQRTAEMDMVSATVSSPQSTAAEALMTVDVTIQPALTRRDTADGSYYSVGGEVWGAPGRPIQPRATAPVTGPAEFTAHGALLVTSTWRTETNFDPLIARPITDVAQPEPDFDVTGWFPAKPFMLNRFGGRDRLVLVAGQYNSALGVERLHDNAELTVYYSQSADFAPPAIMDVQALQSESQIHFEVRAFDISGLHRVVVTYNDGQEKWQTIDLAPDRLGTLWSGDLSTSRGWLSFFVQAVDEAGNVAIGVNKGSWFTTPSYTVFLPVVLKGY